jgi:hypothetical protein
VANWMSQWITRNLFVIRIRLRWGWLWFGLKIPTVLCSCESFNIGDWYHITDVHLSNGGGSDAGVVVAWEVALNLTNAFDGLEDFDLLG